eukprot:m.37465 g.37465  ORF g.37465 m.37465 type:complete len:185 (-) comp17674_c0_seq1:598-1152(-)
MLTRHLQFTAPIAVLAFMEIQSSRALNTNQPIVDDTTTQALLNTSDILDPTPKVSDIFATVLEVTESKYQSDISELRNRNLALIISVVVLFVILLSCVIYVTFLKKQISSTNEQNAIVSSLRFKESHAFSPDEDPHKEPHVGDNTAVSVNNGAQDTKSPSKNLASLKGVSQFLETGRKETETDV